MSFFGLIRAAWAVNLYLCRTAIEDPDPEQGRTDSPDSTSLYVPSIGLIVAGDVVYNQCRMYVGDTTPESRKNWLADLDRLAALNPKMVVAGHKKPGVPDSPSVIQDTKRLLRTSTECRKLRRPTRTCSIR